MLIYFPVTCELLTVGHIKCLEWLREYRHSKNPYIIIGLLTDKALRGYKDSIVPFEDRKYILEHLVVNKFGINILEIVPQDSLNPYKNLKEYHPEYIASGDGWEKEELAGIKKAKVKKLNITLPKLWSVTKLKQKICQQGF